MNAVFFLLFSWGMVRARIGTGRFWLWRSWG